MRLSLHNVLLIVVLAITVTAGIWFIANISTRHGGQSYLSVGQINESEINGHIIEYARMSDEQQLVFISAVQDGSEPIPTSVNVSIWRENQGVRYEDKIYEVYIAKP